MLTFTRFMKLPWHNLIISPVFTMLSLINILLVLICNSPGLIKDFNLEPLPLESYSLNTILYTFHIYCCYYSSFNSTSQPDKNFACLALITNDLTIIFKLRQLINKITSHLKSFYIKLYPIVHNIGTKSKKIVTVNDIN